MRTARLTALAAVAALALAACAPVDEGSDAATGPAGDGAPATVTEGVLTVATSRPAYEPWVVGEPESGEGFEAAVAYAVAEELGYAADEVVWVDATFEQIIAPGAKAFDVAVNQVSISDERRASLDFSAPYYETSQTVVALEGTPAATATTLAELQGVRLGAMVGTTSLTAAQESIAPTADIAVYNDNDQVKQALVAGLVDAIVVDLPTALYMTAAELDGGVLVGQLPDSAGGDAFGFVLDKGSPLTDAVTDAVEALRAGGTLAQLEARWLTDAAGAPVLG
ncbi:transporter substrate-binding domain-containing protein [Cellulomonas shaoxiangyii]|uniref:Amino acid ABC transporter substrate-binding protein n=1 Tax=Cellulomonas shaoxiangyii TaxID=2566013 RepID=A0A4P7SFB1_9CELL|nr:transporter substrate-binding domain-containing protein [Cellulomonas shaoxiangyii]QCB92869.1 amino acid ABC transporter substrate-binding protein [Cellulomonas shaoxiangyii]TGY78922.1 amino acid ABC transporter substrate-binding protein [Cellulomonas shaoxiangyii]